MEPKQLGPVSIPAATSEPWREHYQKMWQYRTIREYKCRDWWRIDRHLLDTLTNLSSGRCPWPLLLYGPPGTGKTTAARCFMDRVPGSFLKCDVFFELATSEFNDVQRWWQGVRHADTLCAVIDDIGKSKTGCTGFEGGGLQRFLDYRKDCHNHAGIYITNIDGETEAEFIRNLGNYYGATYGSVVSRLTCGTRFRLAGRDRRQDARKEGG